MASLMALHMDIAKKAFVRVRDTKFLDLVWQMVGARGEGDAHLREFLPEALAYQVGCDPWLAPLAASQATIRLSGVA